MKYIIVLGDGMADYPVLQLGAKTPLQRAYKPNMDFIARSGLCGLVRTVPEGMPPGSDTANLSVMGYDPKIYYTGRSPLEAVSMGIELGAADLSFRCNLVTLSDEADFAQKTMVDYSSDEISTAESTELIKALAAELNTDILQLFAGISYRHCLVWRNGEAGSLLTPPHDISGRCVGEHLPSGTYGKQLLEFMEKSHQILKNHPVNQARVARGLHPANSAWLWGEGRKPALSSFSERFGIQGAVISAVDLIKGIAICAGMTSIDVEGATGNINTNFRGKGQAAIDALLGGMDYVYIHVEAPDECGHRFEIENKVRAIELIDQHIVGPIMQAMAAAGEDYSILVMPDHPTPLALRTHVSDAVPFALYRSTENQPSGAFAYDEANGKATELYIDRGCEMVELLLQHK